MILLINRNFQLKVHHLIYLGILLCTACIKPETPPEDLISKDTMAYLLMDIHIAEAKVSQRRTPHDSAFMYYQVYKQQLYEKYNIEPQRFQNSFDYYIRNIHEMDKIYEVVIDSLGSLEGRNRITREVRDSLNMLNGERLNAQHGADPSAMMDRSKRGRPLMDSSFLREDRNSKIRSKRDSLRLTNKKNIVH